VFKYEPNNHQSQERVLMFCRIVMMTTQ